MKNQKICRDQRSQNEYKDKLKAESRQIYGVEKCYASHKPYKGLIASHIKPYKLCVLEHDIDSEYNINNGLLLCKSIDDYFDKFLITFDNDGKIICSDNVPNEIQDEFAQYQLDSIVYNDERKRYMQIHRSLFYYKNFYERDDSVPTPLKLENVEIPYFDCGIKVLGNRFIIFKDGYWTICPTSRLKQEFVERTGYKFKYYISNADLAAVLSKQPEYCLTDNITDFLNCPTTTIDVQNPERQINENFFKLSSTNFDIGRNQPKSFISLLYSIFNNDYSAIENFRNIIHCALIGKGLPKGVILYNDISSIDLVFDVIKRVIGNYFFEYQNSKILYRSVKLDSIPNSSILYIRSHNYSINAHIFKRLVDNSLFPQTELNRNKYVAFVSTESKTLNRNINAIAFKFSRITNNVDINNIVENEGADILYWFINNSGASIEDIQTNIQKAQLYTPEFAIDEWLHSYCEIDGHTETRANILYENFCEYAQSNNISNISERYFFIQLSKSFPKKRVGAGMIYIGIKIK